MVVGLYVLLILLALVAFLYASVGHGGASGYMAVMVFLGVDAALIKSSSLVMNLAVSLISFFGFYRGGHFKFSLFWPFAVSSIPLAFLGGTVNLSDALYKKILAVCILLSIVRLVYQFKDDEETRSEVPLWASLSAGGIIGLISGMIGIGGGILLSPLMLLMRWGTLKQTAAVSALFIFVNSTAGLLGLVSKGKLQLSDDLHWAVLATVFGGLVGAYFGSKRFGSVTLRYLLALGLTVASLKLFFT